MSQKSWIIGDLKYNIAISHFMSNLNLSHWQILATCSLNILAILKEPSNVFYANISRLACIRHNYNWLTLFLVDLSQFCLFVYLRFNSLLSKFDYFQNISIRFGWSFQHLLRISHRPLESHHPIYHFEVYIICFLIHFVFLIVVLFPLLSSHHFLVDLYSQIIVDSWGRLNLSSKVSKDLLLVGNVDICYSKLSAPFQILYIAKVFLLVEKEPQGSQVVLIFCVSRQPRSLCVQFESSIIEAEVVFFDFDLFLLQYEASQNLKRFDSRSIFAHLKFNYNIKS